MEILLGKAEYSQYKNKIDEFAKKGMRVLVLANSSEYLTENYIPRDFNAKGLIVIADNVREDAITTVQWFKDNGVAIKVISGDNPLTVSEVSKRVGIENADDIIADIEQALENSQK